MAGARVVVGADDATFGTLATGGSGMTKVERWTWCDDAGVFDVRGLAPGPQRVVIRAPDLAPAVHEVTLPAGGTEQLIVVLGPSSSVRGVVLDGDGAPVRGASVSGGKRTYSQSSFDVTDEQGAFHLGDLPAGWLVVHAKDQEHGRAEEEIDLAAGGVAEVTLVLDRGLELVGRVVDQADRPIAGARVDASPDPEQQTASSSSPALSGTCDDDGRFEIADCPDGPLMLTVYAPESPLLPASELHGVRARAGEVTVRLDETNRPSVRITGSVMDAAGDPIDEVKVVIRRRGGRYYGTMLLGRSDGTFESSLLAPANIACRSRSPASRRSRRSGASRLRASAGTSAR